MLTESWINGCLTAMFNRVAWMLWVTHPSEEKKEEGNIYNDDISRIAALVTNRRVLYWANKLGLRRASLCGIPFTTR